MDEALSPGARVGPYEIEALIGAGGMGRVYRARDPRLGRAVAIKTLPPEALADAELLRRFEGEARTVGALDHPNLLVVHDVGRVGELPYLVSELLVGETLRERLRAQGTLSVRQAIDVALQAARGLAAAHARGVVHRDLKPENLFLTRDRRVKILDFGIAKRVRVPGAEGHAPATEALTVSGVIVGTVGYMAPEQVMAGPIDGRTDVFALGVVLHEMLAGQPPFRRDTALATLTAIATDAPPPLPATVPPVLARLVQRCLEKSPDDRMQSAHDLAIALEVLDATSGPSEAPAGVAAARGAAAVPRRTMLAYGAAALALVAFGAAGGAWSARRGRAVGAPSFRRLTFRRGLIRSARVAPDGETIVYGALWDGEACRVHTTRLDQPESGALALPDANVLAVSRTGELALALGPHRDGVITYGTLASVPLTGGAPRELVEDVKFADWSPDGTELAIVRRVDGRDRLEFPIGRALVAPAAGESTGLGFARVSPDGYRVAFVQYRTPGSLLGRIGVVDRAGAVTYLTEEYLNVHGLAWRGDEILYTAADDRPLFRALHGVRPGVAPREISRVPGNATLWDVLPDGRLVIAQTDDRAVLVTQVGPRGAERDLSWFDASTIADLSADGRQLLFSETGQAGGADGTAYLRPTDGGPAVRIATGLALALSPDARWALCATFALGQGRRSTHLRLVPTGAGEARRIDGEGIEFTGARWTPDADIVVVSAVAAGALERLYRLDLRGGPPTPITPEGVGSWVVAPDGRAVAATGTGEGIQLHGLDGAASATVPGTAAGDSPVGWMRDGLLVRGRADGGSDGVDGAVWAIDLRTGRRSRWADLVPQDRAGLMLLTGFRVTPDGNARAYTWHRALGTLYVADGLT